MSATPRAKVLPFETKATRAARSRRQRSAAAQEKDDLRRKIEELEARIAPAAGAMPGRPMPKMEKSFSTLRARHFGQTTFSRSLRTSCSNLSSHFRQRYS
jgi:hypothetical protein